MNFTLRPDQQTAVDDAVELLYRGRKDGKSSRMYTAPTGSGKSFVLAAVHDIMNRDYGLHYTVVPTHEIAVGLGEKIGVETDRAVLEAVGIWTVKRLANCLLAGAVPLPDTMGFDECFPAGTQVDGRPIETIRPGDVVRTASGTGRAISVFRRPAPNSLVEIQTGGVSLVCTENHPIFTQRGWVNAASLTTDDWTVCRMPAGVLAEHAPTDQGSTGAAGLLLAVVSIRSLVSTDESDECREWGDAEAGKQRYVSTRSTGRRVRQATGYQTQTAGTRRQRSWNDGAGALTGRTHGTYPGNRTDREPRAGLPDTLQNRLGRRGSASRRGDRRYEPQGVEPTGAGSQEGSFLAWARVDRVTVLKRAGAGVADRLCPDGHVYNLRIESDPTYFANGILVHNCHHSVDDTHESVWALCGFCPRIGVTATDYRGTPQETAKLRTAWPDRKPMLTLKDATDRGIIARPRFITWPLLDDHEIDVVNGEFVTRQVDSHVKDKLVDLVDRIAPMFDSTTKRYDRPTMVAFTSVAQCRSAVSVFREHGLSAVVVVGEPDPLFERDRQSAFSRVLARESLLIQVNVVGEGVDLPIRRLIDVAPTMSPMKCMQRWGRATRPVGKIPCVACHGINDGGPSCTLCDGYGSRQEAPPEIISCCHNFTRHGYLWHGVVPPAMYRDNQLAWGNNFKVTRRDMARALGLEGFGRFAVNPVPLADGLTGSLYVLQSQDGIDRYAVYLSPSDPVPRYYHRQIPLTGRTVDTGTFTYQERDYTYPWKRIAAMPELTGCLSVKPDSITPRMALKWRETAARHGLDPTWTPNAREFQILPICWNTRDELS